MTTPDKIKELKPNQIFVFGSNLNGDHIGGAAKLAKDKFGAILGQGEGLQGQSYAFPTLNSKLKKVSKSSLIDSKVRLYEFAEQNLDKEFLVTKVGCGIAGFSEEIMKNIFKGSKPNNIILPEGWGNDKALSFKPLKRQMEEMIGVSCNSIYLSSLLRKKHCFRCDDRFVFLYDLKESVIAVQRATEGGVRLNRMGYCKTRIKNLVPYGKYYYQDYKDGVWVFKLKKKNKISLLAERYEIQ